ncbi:YbaB/EbfC family nucleoid-associated protein [Amycolatopsis acidicola]|uniref:YbaB/EbfC family nucleoid-associated protein n=1 Tax=Amycolatopsis acidicola TaxID=2596893 RepID=A0A5N0VLX5_9PSEU|nr:YbaB/EbfC family nucleoid-associated protein [Amycolatopsis acidicola]KAA9165621.1 YbaB/EbfC family nucleoid-associated protein [Amycolatopsis acidicola]
MTSASNGLGGLMRDPEQAAASIDAWAQGLQDKANRYQAAQERTEGIRLTAVNSDNSVQVTVRADGTVSGLELTGRARSMPLEELSAQILATMQKAQSGIADEVADVMTEEIGDEDPETRSLMLDNLRNRFPDPDEEDEEEDAEELPDEPERPTARGDAEPDDEDNSPW